MAGQKCVSNLTRMTETDKVTDDATSAMQGEAKPLPRFTTLCLFSLNTCINRLGTESRCPFWSVVISPPLLWPTAARAIPRAAMQCAPQLSRILTTGPLTSEYLTHFSYKQRPIKIQILCSGRRRQRGAPQRLSGSQGRPSRRASDPRSGQGRLPPPGSLPLSLQKPSGPRCRSRQVQHGRVDGLHR